MDERYERWQSVVRLREGLRDDSVRVLAEPIWAAKEPTRSAGEGGADGRPRGSFAGALVSEDSDVWRREANCLGHDTEIFFPGRGNTTDLAKARSICADCTVRTECLASAMRNHEIHGVWAGTSERERRRMRRRSTPGPSSMRTRIVALYWQGLMPRDIAAELEISRQQVYWHLANDKRAVDQ